MRKKIIIQKDLGDTSKYNITKEVNNSIPKTNRKSKILQKRRATQPINSGMRLKGLRIQSISSSQDEDVRITRSKTVHQASGIDSTVRVEQNINKNNLKKIEAQEANVANTSESETISAEKCTAAPSVSWDKNEFNCFMYKYAITRLENENTILRERIKEQENQQNHVNELNQTLMDSTKKLKESELKLQEAGNLQEELAQNKIQILARESEIRQLTKQINLLQMEFIKSKLCKFCYQYLANTCYPCGHALCCSNCFPRHNICPVCAYK